MNAGKRKNQALPTPGSAPRPERSPGQAIRTRCECLAGILPMPSGFTLFDDKKWVSNVDLGCRTKSTPGASAGALGAKIAVLGADRWCPELFEKYSAQGCRKRSGKIPANAIPAKDSALVS